MLQKTQAKIETKIQTRQKSLPVDHFIRDTKHFYPVRHFADASRNATGTLHIMPDQTMMPNDT
jgi:hypothetical protein